MRLGTVPLAICLALIVLVGTNYVLNIFFSRPKFNSSGWDAVRIREARNIEVEFDTRNTLQIYSECKPACFPYINPLEEFKPEGGRLPLAPFPKNKNAIYCNESGRWAIIRNDQFGFRNNRVASYERSDIVLIGDSFAAGACVDEGETLADQLRNSLDLDVLNRGVGGQQPLGELAVLKEYLPQASTLVWFFFEGNDYMGDRNSDFLKQYLEEGFLQFDKAYYPEAHKRFQRLLQERVAAAEAESDHRKVTNHKQLQDTINDYFSPMTSALEYVFKLNVTELSIDRALFSEILDEAREYAAGKGFEKFIFVYLPAYELYAWRPEGHPRRLVFDHLKQTVLLEASSSGWDILDVDSLFSRHNNPLTFFPFETHAHYTPEGYSLVAGLIIDEIEE